MSTKLKPKSIKKKINITKSQSVFKSNKKKNQNIKTQSLPMPTQFDRKEQIIGQRQERGKQTRKKKAETRKKKIFEKILNPHKRKHRERKPRINKIVTDNMMEIKEIIAMKADNDILDTIKLDTLNDLCNFEAKEGFMKIFKFDPDVKIIISDTNIQQFKTARDWFEPSTPTTQCENIIGKPTEDTVCYICGFKLNDDNPDNSPECEHILPVFQACCFLELYKAAIGKKSPEMNLEYNWAHRCCNQIKSDISFLNYDNSYNKFIFDEEHCYMILQKIYKGAPSYCNGLKNKFKSIKFKDWVNNRKNYIKTEIIDPICNYLNDAQKKEENKGLFYLSILSNLISATDSNYRDPVQRYTEGLKIISPKIPESIHKGSIYINISTQLAETLVSYPNWNLKITTKNENRGPNKEFSFLMNKIFSLNEEDLNLSNFCTIDNYKKPDFGKLIQYISSSLVSSKISTKNQGVENEYYFQGFYRDIYSLLPYIFNNITDEKYKRDICEIGVKILIYLTILKNIKNIDHTIHDVQNKNNIILFFDFLKEMLKTEFDKLKEDPAIQLFLYSILIKNDIDFKTIIEENIYKPNEDELNLINIFIDNNRIRSLYDDYFKNQVDIKDTKFIDDIADMVYVSVNTLVDMKETLKKIKSEENNNDLNVDEELNTFIDKIITSKLNRDIDIEEVKQEHTTNVRDVNANELNKLSENLRNYEQEIKQEIEEAAEILNRMKTDETNVEEEKKLDVKEEEQQQQQQQQQQDEETANIILTLSEELEDAKKNPQKLESINDKYNKFVSKKIKKAIIGNLENPSNFYNLRPRTGGKKYKKIQKTLKLQKKQKTRKNRIYK